MNIVRGLRNLASAPASAIVTIGNFDGVHAGHKEIFRRVIEEAKRVNGTAVVYTFDPHPLKIVAPEFNLQLLTTFKKKMELIAEAGIDLTICADFDRTFARMHPRDFARKLMNGLNMKKVFVGHDYSFGAGRQGGIDYLKKMGEELIFGLDVIDPVEVDGSRVSSTLIRECIAGGDVTQASRYLGREYSIAGKVVSGYSRGHAIGFPTANLDTPYEVIPAVGVYAGRVRLQGQIHNGVVNIGLGPTFDRDDFIVEVHLLDKVGDIYGEEIELSFTARLRDEKKFDTVDDLKKQITEDIKKAESIFS